MSHDPKIETISLNPENNLDFEKIEARQLSPRNLRRALQNIQMSADAKSIISNLSNMIIKVNGRVVQLGRLIISFALDLIKISPTAVFGAIIGAIISLLISGIPILGPPLSAIIGPLLIAFGIGMGAIADLKHGEVGARINSFVDNFRPLA